MPKLHFLKVFIFIVGILFFAFRAQAQSLISAKLVDVDDQSVLVIDYKPTNKSYVYKFLRMSSSSCDFVGVEINEISAMKYEIILQTKDNFGVLVDFYSTGKNIKIAGGHKIDKTKNTFSTLCKPIAYDSSVGLENWAQAAIKKSNDDTRSFNNTPQECRLAKSQRNKLREIFQDSDICYSTVTRDIKKYQSETEHAKYVNDKCFDKCTEEKRVCYPSNDLSLGGEYCKVVDSRTDQSCFSNCSVPVPTTKFQLLDIQQCKHLDSCLNYDNN